ncbi:MAG: ATP-binding cassette domain-containing protein [Hyphomicrobiaceae bacterium]
MTEPIISVRDLIVGFGDHTVLDGVTVDVLKGEIFGFVGGSGSGKSVLLRTIIGLLPARAGTITVMGTELIHADEEARRAIQRRWGVLFQQGALFSSLNVIQNVQFPLREFLDLPPDLLDEIARIKLEMVGIRAKDHHKLPSELSGGMIKRVALARSLAMDPELVFLDEPTSGLDPISAGDFDELIKTLQKTLGLTVFMITHDLETLHAVCDRIGILAGGKVVACGPMETILKSTHPWAVEYFHGRRGGALADRRMTKAE